MVPYHKLLSTILSQGGRSKGWNSAQWLSLFNQQFKIPLGRGFPILPGVNFDFVVKDLVERSERGKYYNKPTWAWDEGISLKLRDAAIHLKSQRSYTFSIAVPPRGNEFGLHYEIMNVQFIKFRGFTNVIIFLSSVDVLNALPYRIASVALFAEVLRRKMKLKLGTLNISIGESYINVKDKTKSKQFLIQGISPDKKKVYISDKRADKVEHFLLVNNFEVS
jgi:thymidylate synthase